LVITTAVVSNVPIFVDEHLVQVSQLDENFLFVLKTLQCPVGNCTVFRPVVEVYPQFSEDQRRNLSCDRYNTQLRLSIFLAATIIGELKVFENFVGHVPDNAKYLSRFNLA
jgi:hypothetical protein